MFSPEKQQFFDNLEQQGLAITFDDVRLRTQRSHVSATQVDINSRFSRNVELKVPIVSAAMDTITESEMAIAMAKIGGLGIIHAGLSIEAQAKEVRKVKWHLNGLIEAPKTAKSSQTLDSILAYCDKKDYDFRTFPVVDENERLVGLLTQNDFDFCDDLSQNVAQNMTPLSEIKYVEGVMEPEEAYAVMKEYKKKTLPLVDEEMRISGLYVLSDVLRIVRDNPDNYNLDKRGRLRTGIAVPTDPEEALLRVQANEGYVDVAVIDTAQGDSDYAFDTLRALKCAQKAVVKTLKENSGIDIVVGNISEGESAYDLVNQGADGIKDGQGGGAICSTRPETGIGTPQVTATYETVKAVQRAAKGNNEPEVPVCSDGGLKDPGDISIAIAAGASSVMMGNMLSATKQCPGDIVILDNGARVMLYRGMGSPSALRDNAAARKRYGVEGMPGTPLAEGVESYKPYKGSVYEVVDHYVKALRKSMSYVGAKDIQTHRDKSRLWRITNAGLRESHPHDVQIINK